MKQEIEKILPGVKNNLPLAGLTTLGIGGQTTWFYQANSNQEVVKAIDYCRTNNLPFFVLGSGSNLLIADNGFDGMVIKMANSDFKVNEEKLIAESGISLATLIDKTADLGLSGLEFTAGIPGTLGGAVFGNVGTSEEWIGNLVEKVEVLDKSQQIKVVLNEDCDFAYRQSRFQKSGEIILTVFLNLKREEPSQIKKEIKSFLAKRGPQPRGKSSGSIFKNPDGYKAGQLIEECGLKGKQIGQAQISPDHGNWIINLGGAKAKDVLELIRIARQEVKQKFKIDLQLEIKLLNL